jgi:hypothetical protein
MRCWKPDIFLLRNDFNELRSIMSEMSVNFFSLILVILS